VPPLAVLLATSLSVPFVPQQRPETCGAAALAMVLRYWGQPGSHDELARELGPADFQGVAGSRLAELARARGLTATAYQGDLVQLRDFVGKGRPLIVAWSLGGGRFHDVVVVGFAPDGRVVVNDPARGAGRAVAARDFERRWAAASHWTLLVMPVPREGGGGALADGLAASREGRHEEAARALAQAVAEAPTYDALVALGVAQARVGDTDAARAALDRARALDPARPEALVESGGLHFLEQRYGDAAEDFGRALDRGEDPYARRMRASSRHLAGRSDEALDDWNRLGEPRVTAVHLGGIRHTRSRVVLRELAFAEGGLLTRNQLRETRLRLHEVGVFDRVRLRPVPKGDGTADVDVAFLERHGFGSPLALGMRLGADAFRQQVRVTYDNLGGQGIVVGALGKWQSTQPRIVAGVAWPHPFGLPFHLRVEAEHARPEYDLGGRFRLRTRGVDLRLRRVLGARTVGEIGWTARVRRVSTVRADAPEGRLTGLTARIERRLVDGLRHRLTGSLEGFRAIDFLGSQVPATRGIASVKYIGLWSGPDIDDPLPGSSLGARLTLGVAGSNLPLDLMFMPGAASETAWPLRAHRQKSNGVLGPAPIGPKMALLNAEWRQRIWGSHGLEFGVAALYDALHMVDTLQGPRSSTFHDAGVGMRLVSGGSVLRIDYSHSLTGDHRSAWTAGFGHAF
jgi:Peptidase C39 family/Tetratricopeptide repeat/Surface antigen variable number repeat